VQLNRQNANYKVSTREYKNKTNITKENKKQLKQNYKMFSGSEKRKKKYVYIAIK
jgi:hypothetical protein